MTTKKCTACGEEKSTLEFPPRKNSRDGLHQQCRRCVQDKQRVWERKNPDKVKAYKKRSNNSDSTKTAKKKWLLRNKDAQYARIKDWATRHRDYVNQRTTRYRATRRDRVNELSRKNRKRQYAEDPTKFIQYARRRKQAMIGSFTHAEWEALIVHYGHCCARCNRPSSERPLTADHVIPLCKKGPNTIDNIQPLCKPCNSTKASRCGPEWDFRLR